MPTYLIVILVITVVAIVLVKRAREVKQELIDEALERGDEEEAEEIENMSDEEIIDNYEDQL